MWHVEYFYLICSSLFLTENTLKDIVGQTATLLNLLGWQGMQDWAKYSKVGSLHHSIIIMKAMNPFPCFTDFLHYTSLFMYFHQVLAEYLIWTWEENQPNWCTKLGTLRSVSFSLCSILERRIWPSFAPVTTDDLSCQFYTDSSGGICIRNLDGQSSI